jgi:hypothetical protein
MPLALCGLTDLARLSFMIPPIWAASSFNVAPPITPIVGTYAVNPDGTGTMQWFSNGSNHARAFAIVDGGRELQFGGADGLDVACGVARKQ